MLVLQDLVDAVFEGFFKQPSSPPEFLAIDSCHLLLSIQQSSNMFGRGSNSHNGNQQTIHWARCCRPFVFFV